MTDQTSIDAARATVEARLEEHGLNLLINNAATTKRMKLEQVTPEAMMEIYEVNCVAPLMITKVLTKGRNFVCFERTTTSDPYNIVKLLVSIILFVRRLLDVHGNI